MNAGVTDLIKNTFICKDIYGNTVEIDIHLLAPFTIMGMSIDTIAELRRQYFKRGGHEPITYETVRQVFSGK